jgi:thymidylate kinase
MNPIICFIGIDGSGKSTICKLLVKELKAKGIPSRYVYGRFLPKLMAPVFMLTSSLMPEKHKKLNSKNTRLANKRQLLSNPVISQIFILGVIIDQLFQIMQKITLQSLFKKEVILCDRYFYDTVLIDLAIPCNLDSRKIVWFVNRYLPLFPKTSMVFFVDVPAKVAFERKNDIISMDYIESLSKSYRSTAKYFGATRIDGTKKLSEIKPFLLEKLKEKDIA